MKSLVYVEKSHTRAELLREINNIAEPKITTVLGKNGEGISHIMKKAKLCLHCEGEHFEQLL